MDPTLIRLGAFGLIAWGLYRLLGQKSSFSTQATAVAVKPPVTAKPSTAVKPTSSLGGSASIAAIQSRLNAAGANPQLVVDGVSGPKTTAAIKAFQSSHGITPDGVVGPITQAALGMGGTVAVPTDYTQIPLITPDFTPHQEDN